MKKLTTSEGVFGPYEQIDVLEDRYRCDGGDLPFTVVGQGTISDVVDGDFPEPQRQNNQTLSQAQIKQNLKQSAIAKLTALGLTADEIKAIVGA